MSFLDQLISAGSELLAALHQAAVISFLGSVIVVILVSVACVISATYTHFSNKKVQHALRDERDYQTWRLAMAGTLVVSQKEDLQQRLSFLWASLFEFQYTLFGTTKEAQENVWEQYSQFGHTMPPLVVPEQHKAFHGELASLMTLVMHVGTMVEDGRLQSRDLDAVEHCIEDLFERFNQFKHEQREQHFESYNVLSDLRGMRDEHDCIAQTYCLTRLNSAFQHFPGMIHALEGMLEDETLSVAYARSYVCALRKQLDTLKAQYEQGIL